jgi:hypothetical protein
MKARLLLDRICQIEGRNRSDMINVYIAGMPLLKRHSSRESPNDILNELRNRTAEHLGCFCALFPIAVTQRVTQSLPKSARYPELDIHGATLGNMVGVFKRTLPSAISICRSPRFCQFRRFCRNPLAPRLHLSRNSCAFHFLGRLRLS